MRKSKLSPLVALLAIAFNFHAACSFAAVFSVSPEGTAAGADCEDATPAKGLQACLDKAQGNGEPDTVELAPGRYVGRFFYVNQCQPGAPDCPESLDLVGLERPTIEPGDSHPVLPALLIKTNNGDPKVTVRGIDFDGSQSPNAVSGLSVELNNTDFELSDCGFSGFKGGGAFILSHGAGNSIDVLGNSFLGNQGLAGAGIQVQVTETTAESDNTEVEVSNNLIAGNASREVGGGIAIIAASSTVTVSNNIIHENSVGEVGSIGGGIFTLLNGSDTSALLVHNTIVGNSADGGGGGAALLVNSGAEVTDLFNNIVFGNQSAESGADILVDAPVVAGEAPLNFGLFANIFGELANDCGEACLAEAGNILDVASVEDLFVAPGQNNLRLKELSRAINAGAPDAPAIPQADFEGNLREDGLPDIGALEFQELPVETPPTTPEASPSVAPQPNPPGQQPSGDQGAPTGGQEIAGGGCSLAMSSVSSGGAMWLAVSVFAALFFQRARKSRAS